MRCFVPPNFFQLVKTHFYNTKKWEYVKPYYTKLFNTIYEDILPDTELLHSSDEVKYSSCTYTLSEKVIEQALKEYKERILNKVKKIKNDL